MKATFSRRSLQSSRCVPGMLCQIMNFMVTFQQCDNTCSIKHTDTHIMEALPPDVPIRMQS